MNWTPDRPTKPGKYWLSVHPDKRGILFEAGVYEVVLWAADQKVRHVGGLTIVPEDRLIGAQWLPYVEPPDPFAEPVEPKSQQTLSITTEERKTLSSALHTMAGSLRKLAKTNPSDAHGAIAEADRMDALNARICEVRGFTPDETRRAMDGGALAEPVPVEMYRMSDDAKTPNLRLILSVEPGAVVLYEADMTSRSATAKETAVHDKIIMSLADARWLRDALQRADLSDPPEVTSAESVPSLRERVEGLARFDLEWVDSEMADIQPCESGEYLKCSEVLALVDEVTR